MKHLFAAVLMLALSIMPGLAQDARSGEVTQTIQSQLDAFQKDDFSKAFTYASPTIKRLFGSPDRLFSFLSSRMSAVASRKLCSFGTPTGCRQC